MIHFTTASVIDAVKESGDRQCKENGGVNLFSFISILQKCPKRIGHHVITIRTSRCTG